ncbi:hypothetical protein BOX15_Mlig033081g6 [Macrostomum lignano]|uniref:E3 ubiquitin-protein ligase Hakai n=1 Tax=Macrostomum lignano TaxID=282301 RepID=A0A267H192_9PLAT|nr:hypothetical protein BOX15_Mlig033081g6 [Macrostomum lignano]
MVLHFCDACDRPIQSFGRLLPCKHAACRTCAQSSKLCPRCQDPIEDTEIVPASQLHICMHDSAAPHGRSGCKRTYLSQRDLLAHIEHRHGGGTKLIAESATAASLPPPPLQQQQQQQQQQMNPPMSTQPQQSLAQYLPMPVVASTAPGSLANPLHHHHPYQQAVSAYGGGQQPHLPPMSQMPPPPPQMMTSPNQQHQQHPQQMTFRPPMRPGGGMLRLLRRL